MGLPTAQLVTLVLCALIKAVISYGTWMSLGMQALDIWRNPVSYSVDTTSSSSLCSRIKGLSYGQNRLCQLRQDHMESVGRGARAGIAECQYQFRDSRWNCSTVDDSTVFGPLLQIPSRESAFAHSVASAGVVTAIARACRNGQLSSCSCSDRARPNNLNQEWNWSGCGDNIEYGYRFAKNFVDIRERELRHKQKSEQHVRSVMNLHNNEAGRLSVIKLSKVSCKCHGVSGSCSVVTCWQKLPSFREVGSHLKDKYDGAVEVRINRKGKLRRKRRIFKKPTARDLVYTENSPDYCEKNKTLGFYGTTGRSCDRRSPGMGGCTFLCCGRGYNTRQLIVEQKCHCKFVWCCKVQCQTCIKKLIVHTCK